VPVPTEPIGSIPRPVELIEGTQAAAEGRVSPDELDALFAHAVQDTISRFEATSSANRPLRRIRCRDSRVSCPTAS
jgi:methionine synthase II (cobalamin-independent)